MKEFLQLMRRFVSPYKKYIGWAVLLNILSAVFNVFSFTFLIPILGILFKTGDADKVYQFMEWGSAGVKEVAVNNFYYYVSQMIVDNGPTTALIFLGLFPHGDDPVQDRLLLRLFGGDDSAAHGRGARHPHYGLL